MDGKQIPNEVLQRSIKDLQEAAAAIGSHNNPVVLASFIRPPSTVVLALISVVLLIIAIILAQISNYREIQRNWSTYRCDPAVAPFAEFYGFSLSETLNFCTSEAVREHAGGVIDPIYQGIAKVNGVVDGVYSQVQSIAGGVGGLLSGLREFVANFISSMRLLGTRVRMTFIRMKEIFGRVYGLFISFAYAAISAITFGENLICNPLVVFLGTITGVDICCFAPDTPIRMADGSTRWISQIRIGDQLAGGAEVESLYLFSGEDTKMCRLFGIHVSANHYIKTENGQMIRVGDHPDAVAAECLPRLWCLGTSTHTIPVDLITFADYEESSDPAVIAEAQRIAEMELNKGLPPGPTVPDYGLGLDPSFHVHMVSGAWKPITQVRIDDQLMGGGIVKGVISEMCEKQVKLPGGNWVSAAQLLLWEGVWRRAANIWPSHNRETTMYHLMVTANLPFTIRNEGEVFVVWDYAELTSEAIQKPYDAVLTNKVDSGAILIDA